MAFGFSIPKRKEDMNISQHFLSKQYNMLLKQFLEVELILVNEDCGPYQQLLTPASFCVGYKGRTSGCNGDSGKKRLI